MHREADVVDTALLESLVVVVGKAERADDHDGPHAVLPAGDGIVIGGRSLGILAADEVIRNHVAFLPARLGIERHGVLSANQEMVALMQLVGGDGLVTDLLFIPHELGHVGFFVGIPAVHVLAFVALAELEDIAVIGHTDRVAAIGAPLDQINEAAGGLDFGDLLKRFAGLPVGRVGARGRQVLAHIVLLDCSEQRVGGDFLLGELLRHVARAIVAGQPATLLRKTRYLAVVEHD